MAELKILRRGSTGPQVEFLQLALNRAGYGLVTDGIFGRLTEAAVRAFQAANGLVSDGIVGARTWQRLTPYLTGYTKHTIKNGDTLYKIAAQYDTTIAAIEIANPGLNPLQLMVGRTIVVPLGFEVVPVTISFTSTVLEYSVRGLKARYPFLMTGSAGSSVTGKNIRYITIGTGGKAAFYNASHHANEWITSPLLMKFLERYAAAYSSGGSIGGESAVTLYNSTTLHLMPMVNPDGVDLVTGELNSGEYFQRAKGYAEDYPSIPFPSGWKANVSGVDPNLQYPAGWERAKEIKFAQGFVSPAPRDYVGSGPLVAPESQAAYNYTIARDFDITISYHTQGEVIYWKYLDYSPENAYEIARKFAELSGYAVSETPYESGFAGYKDWFILRFNKPGYTIEAGTGTAPLPLSQFGEIYSDNLGILVSGMTVI